MGTMHLRNASAYTFADKALVYMEQCSLYAAETDIRLLERADLSFRLPEGTTIRKLLGEKRYLKTGRILHKSFGIDWPAYNEALPFYITSMLSGHCTPVDFPYTLDQWLWQKALGNGLSVCGLETLEKQQEILQSLPIAFQIQDLLQVASNVSAFRNRMATLQELYAQGNWQILYKLTRKQTGSIRKIMLHRRNEHMMEAFLPLAAENAVFVSVGASHLGGNIGLLALLKRAGARVKYVA